MVKPLRELGRFGARLGRLDQIQWVAWCQAQAVCAEGEGAQHHLFGSTLCISHHGCALRNATTCLPKVHLAGQPLGALVGEPAGLQSVATGTVAFAAQELQGFFSRRQDELNPFKLGQRVTQFGVGEQRE